MADSMNQNEANNQCSESLLNQYNRLSQKSEQMCPNCGYCPTCGQKNEYKQYPQYLPSYAPYWYYGQTTCQTGTQNVQ